MAIYHLSIKIFSRGKGRSAVAAAAYRSAELIKSEYDGRINNYTRKSGVAYIEIMLPANAPSEYKNRSVLWNAVEKAEKSKNAQLAREVEFALPAELTQEQNIALAHDYVKRNFVDKGMCADICIHDKGDGKPHAHVMLTMRPIKEDGTWGSKQKKEYILDNDGNKIYDPKKRQYKCRSIPSTDWNEQTNAERWREDWAKSVNTALEKAGIAERIDNRSYIRQGLMIKPTIKLGVAAHQMELRGIRTERGNINREIEITNQKIRQLKARITKLEKWIDEESKNEEPPTLADVISDILDRRGKNCELNQSRRIYNLQQAAKMVNFLTDNRIADLDGLNNFVSAMQDKQFAMRDKLKPIERRMKILDEHIRQVSLYFEHRGIYKKYKAVRPKKQQDFYESNRADITLYESTERYLKGVLNGRTTIPTGKWKKELADLTAERKQLNGEYKKLKDEVGKVEKISRSVQGLLCEERKMEQPSHRWSLDLEL